MVITKKRKIYFIILTVIIFVCLGIFKYFNCNANFYVNGNKVYSEKVMRGSTANPKESDIQSIGFIINGWSLKEDPNSSDEYVDIYSTPINGNTNFYADASYDIKELPVLELDTGGYAKIYKTKNLLGSVELYTNSSQPDFSSACYFKGHGTTSWNTYKSSYQFKFNQVESLLGLNNKYTKWILTSNCYDHTLSRNMIAYALMNDFPEITNTIECTPIDLYINKEYEGVYLLCTKPYFLQDPDDINNEGESQFLIELTSEEREIASGSKLNYSYILSNEMCFAIKYPDYNPGDYTGITPAAVEPIQNAVDNAIDVLEHGSWSDICECYEVDSFAASYIIQELFANIDVGAYSYYLCNTTDGKLSCGPVWDFDIGAGNVNHHMGNEKECPSTGYIWATWNYFYDQMLKHSEFKELVKELFEKYDATILEEIETANPESETCYYNLYRQAFDRNFEKHQVLGEYIWPQPEEEYKRDTVYLHFDYLYNWLSSRYVYLKDYYGAQ